MAFKLISGHFEKQNKIAASKKIAATVSKVIPNCKTERQNLVTPLNGNMIDQYNFCLSNPPICIGKLADIKGFIIHYFFYKTHFSNIPYLGPCAFV